MHLPGEPRLTVKSICFQLGIILAAGLLLAQIGSAGPAVNYTLIVPVAVFTTESLNQCDTHVWKNMNWGNQTTLQWSEFHGYPALRANFVADGGTETYICTDFFSPEDWSTVTQIKVDVYVENGKTDMGLRLELQDLISGYPPNYTISKNSGEIPPGSGNTWFTVTWNVSISGFLVSQVWLIPTDMDDSDRVCFKNFRITRGGSDEIWETFANPSYTWEGYSDFVPWQTAGGERNEPISHKVTRPDSAPGALCIPWSASRTSDPFVKMQANNLHYHSLAAINKFRAWVYSDQTNIQVYMGFWKSSGSQWVETDRRPIANANQWQQLEWDKPAGNFDWEHPDSFSFLIQTDLGPASGQAYIDAIEFVK